MFDRFVAFLRDLPGVRPDPDEPDRNDPRVAAAALMIHVMEADGGRLPEEEERLRGVLAETYGVTGATLETLFDAADHLEHEAVDLYAFTSVLKRSLDHPARVELVRLLWEIVYADGVRDEIEDNVVWRIAELLDVEGRDRIAMRQRAAAAHPDAVEASSED